MILFPRKAYFSMEYSINNNKEHNNVWTTLRMRNMKHTPLIWMEGKQSLCGKFKRTQIATITIPLNKLTSNSNSQQFNN